MGQQSPPEVAASAGKQRILQAPLMHLPLLNDLPPAAVNDLRRAQRYLGDGSPMNLSRAAAKLRLQCLGPQELYKRATHRLASVYRARNPQHLFYEDRAQFERCFVSEIHGTFGPWDHLERSEFFRIIELYGSRLDFQGLRTTDVFSTKDVTGTRVQFPDSAMIKDRLSDITDHLFARRGECPIFPAAIALCAIPNLHPFADGNGRLGRILFNYIVGTERAGRGVSLYEINNRCNGSLTLHIREAIFLREWSGLARYLRICVEIDLLLS